MKQIILYALAISMSFSFANERTSTQKSRWFDDQSYSFSNINYHDRSYTVFKCFDAWGNKLKGRFDFTEKRLIELGGGFCNKRFNQGYQSDLSVFDGTNIPLGMVVSAIRHVKSEYRIRNAKLIKAKKLKVGRKNFKYLLVYKSPGYGKRTFKIKQNAWTGEILKLREV